jgi:hypothetical protein
MRERWGLSDHQQLSLALEDKLAFTATATGSYEEAAQLAHKWGVSVSASAVHALAQRLGSRAEARTKERLAKAPVENQPQRAATALGVLMLDGWQVRQRGPGWGKGRTIKPRVEWHEWKTGVFYRHEQSGHTAGERGVRADKIVVGWGTQKGHISTFNIWRSILTTLRLRSGSRPIRLSNRLTAWPTAA